MLFSKTIASLKAKLLQIKEENFKLRGGKPSTRKAKAATAPDPRVEEFHIFPREMHQLNEELQAEQEENAALKAQNPSAPTPTAPPATSPAIAKPALAPSMNTAPPTTPKVTSAAPVASTTTAPPKSVATPSKFMHRHVFDAMEPKQKNEFIRNGGHLFEMEEGDSPKRAAEAAIQNFKGTPEEAAEALMKGFSLSTADTTKLILAKYNGQYDAKSCSFYAEAGLKAAVAKAEKSPKATGFLLPGAQPVDESRLSRKKMFPTFKKDGEVSEPDRLKAETALLSLWQEFDKISEPMVRGVWWSRNRDTVFSHAVNETRLGSQWLGIFIGKLQHTNAHLF